MKLPRLLVPAALVTALAVGALLVYQSVAVKPQMPNVDYVLLNGTKLNSSQWAGRVMLVNFWSTDCPGCVEEMPQIVALHEKLKDRGFDTLAVAMSYDPPAYVMNFAESRKLPFGVAIDNNGEMARRFPEVKLTPTSFLIDKHGAIVKRYVGTPDFAALQTQIEQLLAAG